MGEQWLLFVSFQEKLKAEFPELYSDLAYFDCGPGWYELLRDLSFKIKEHLIKCTGRGYREDCFPFAVVQVKEKYGELRFYVDAACHTIDKMIDGATKLSQSTCENCSKPGSLRTINNSPSGWVHCRCDECWEVLERKHKPFLEME